MSPYLPVSLLGLNITVGVKYASPAPRGGLEAGVTFYPVHHPVHYPVLSC